MKYDDVFLVLALATRANGLHHMKREIILRQQGSSHTTPLVVSNNCGETIYPGILTQAGTGPASTGFELTPGTNKSQTVSHDWQGRVWGRTNCTFNSQGTSMGGGKACGSGDCNGGLGCLVTGDVPVTLAEFTLDGGDGQTYFDISLVDGYNLPVAIVLVPHGNVSLDDIPPNLTSPSCIGTASQLAEATYDPYSQGQQTFLGTNSSYPLPFDQKLATSTVAQWCPWDLQRPAFNPCLSACAKYKDPKYCCTGKYDSPKVCKPNYYSTVSKEVCPDAYSFAYDDQSSTFIIPSGAGFEVVFCPGGRSTTILKSKAAQLSELASSGTVSGSGGASATASSLATPKLDAPGVCLWMAILMAAFMILFA
ncbi:hypothetical protein AAFC00_003092 [Neodothiora populina]|uniref:Osmotin, thaumatin-like protein n=1 Tax=Neodothiora populina TaxID=2781224 RepID=A0ABR3P9Z2_9PEZI